MVCGVCGNAENNRRFQAREMMFGWRHKFDYFECAQCGTLQIVQIPANLGEYYPPNYYSFNAPEIEKIGRLRTWFRTQRYSYYLGAKNPIGYITHRRGHHKKPKMYNCFRAANLDFNSSIADIGSGNGRLLDELRRDGFRNLTGIDPFLERDETRENGVRLMKKELSDVRETFDFVMLHHSFEHMDKPQQTFREISRVLKTGGRALIRVPVAAHAWKTYDIDWFQLDAPRHLFVHTHRGLKLLGENADMKLERVDYDSSATQFTYSEGYGRDFSLFSPEMRQFYIELSADEQAEYQKRAEELNREEQGDQAAFLFVKS